jgi:hypothetical protein
MIQTNLAGMEVGLPAETPKSLFDEKAVASRISPQVVKHFRNTLGYVAQQKRDEAKTLEAGVSGIQGGFGSSAKGRWGDVEIVF